MLLISDYDGTIKKYYNNPTIIQKIDLKNEVKVINKFVNEGNEFVICTYRKTPSIKREVEKHKILYNYLITYNGLVTLDNNNRVINANYLDKDIIKEIIFIAKKNDFFDKLVFYNEFGLNDNIDNIIMIGIKNISAFNILNAFKNLNICYDYYKKTTWLHKITNKIDAINILKNYLNIEDKNIYTIGDSDYDYEIVKNYNGYCIIKSELDNTLNNGIQRVKNVRTLIKKIK